MTGTLRHKIQNLSQAEQASEISDALCALLRESLDDGIDVSPESLLPDLDPGGEITGLWALWADKVPISDAIYDVIRPFIGEQLEFPIFVKWELKGARTLRDVVNYLVRQINDSPPPDLAPLEPHSILPTPKPYRGRTLDGSRMVFLLGTARSGTTLLRTMLDGHSDLYSPPELHLLPFDGLRQRIEYMLDKGYTWPLFGFRQAYRTAKGEVDDGRVEEEIPIEETGADLATAYEALVEWGEGRILVDKSPLYLDHRGILDRAEALFDQPRYIYLTRHPLSVMESLVRMRFHGVLYVDMNPWHFAEQYWVQTNENALAFLETIPSDRKTHVRYEDLVSAIEETQRRICLMLGIDYQASLANPYEREGGVKGMGDPNLKKRSAVDSSLADAWRHKPRPKELHTRTVDLAKKLEYDVS